MKRKLLVLIATSFLLVGCNTKKSNSPISSETSSSETSSSSSSSSEDPGVVLVSEIKLSKKNIHLNPGKSTPLVATVLPENATHKEIKWVIGNSNLISYENGKVVAGSSTGNTTIYAVPASEEDQAPGFKYDTCEVLIDNEVPATYDYDGYYEGLTWTDSEDLIDKLHTIISTGYTSLKYDGNWATNQGADQALDDFEMVDLVYDNNNELKTKTFNGSSGWQREHAFAASLMTGFTTGDAVGVGKGRATDFHNLFAANNYANGSRGNKNFGMADPNAESYKVEDAYKCDINNFEPSDYDKGRLSRAIFYMAVMYNQTEQETVKVKLNYNEEDQQKYGQQSTTVSIPVTYQPLTIIEEYVSYSKFTYTNWHYKSRTATMTDDDYNAMLAAIAQYGEDEPGYAAYSMANCQYAIGNLSTLLTWGVGDVDYLEMQHNNFVHGQSGQGNRNPFVDYPELVSYCFGSLKDQAGSLADLTASYTELEMDKDEINHYAIETAKRQYDEGATFKTSDYTIKAVKNDLSVTTASYTDTTPEYTFTSQDVTNKTKDLTINTPINNIKLTVGINAGSIESCSYQGLVVNVGKGSFSNGGTTAVDGQNWLVSWTGTAGAMGNKDSTYGLAFGVASGNKYMEELTFQTTDSKTVDRVYFKGSCKAGQTIDVTIKVGDQIVCEKSITRTSGVTTAPEVVGASFASLTGKVTIIIGGAGASAGAIYVHTLAFNVVS